MTTKSTRLYQCPSLRDRTGLGTSEWILLYETTMEGCLQKLLCIIQKKMGQNENGGEKSSCEDQENTAIMPKFWDVTLAGDDSRNIQTHKVILVAINNVKEGFKKRTSIHTLSSTWEGRGTKQDDQTGAGGREFPCDICGKTYDTITRRWQICKKLPRTSTAAAWGAGQYGQGENPLWGVWKDLRYQGQSEETGDPGKEHSWARRSRVASCISSTPSWRQSHGRMSISWYMLCLLLYSARSSFLHPAGSS